VSLRVRLRVYIFRASLQKCRQRQGLARAEGIKSGASFYLQPWDAPNWDAPKLRACAGGRHQKRRIFLFAAVGRAKVTPDF
jgi:hypothetical protein